MGRGFYRTVAKELKALGFHYWKPAKGSHQKWRRDSDGAILLVPKNLYSRHTANGVFADAGSDKRV